MSNPPVNFEIVRTRERALECAQLLLANANANMEMSTNSIRPEPAIASAQACAVMAQSFMMLHDRLPPASRSLGGI